MRDATLLALLLLPALPASAQTVVGPEARTGLELTVYGGYAHVRDARRVPSGTRLVWTEIPPTIDPGTLILARDGEPVPVSLARYEGEESGNEILARRVGAPATLIAPDGRRIEATIVSPHGRVFRVEDRLVLFWDGAIEVPDGPYAAPGPRLVFDLGGSSAGVLTAAFLADGPSWSADYTAVLDDDAMTLGGWATIQNPLPTPFPDARVELVAGDVRRAGGGARSPSPMVADRAMRMEASPAAPGRESLADRVLYALPGRVTLAPTATTRAPLFDEARLDVERDYVLEGPSWIYQSANRGPTGTSSPAIRLTFTVEGIAEGDAPLPAGTLHLYAPASDGGLRFAGSAPVPDLPDGEEAEVEIGTAFDLVAERTQTDFRRIDERTVETAWRLEVRNRGREARTVTVLEPIPGEWAILEESRPHERVDAGTVRWSIPVSARGSATLEWRVRSTF